MHVWIELMLIYIQAYFENSRANVFGVVQRSNFENRLRVQFQSPNTADEDVAWYALRNAVYAIGRRVVASMDRTGDFAEIQSKSLRFFHNAFSVYVSYFGSTPPHTAFLAFRISNPSSGG
jgi:hypothetical protein